MPRLCCSSAPAGGVPSLPMAMQEGVPPEDLQTANIRSELEALSLGALARKAALQGIDEQARDEAMERGKPQMVELLLPGLLDRARLSSSAADDGALRAELATLKLAPLQRRAISDGVDAAKVEDAVDGDNPKQALTELILNAKLLMLAKADDAACARAEHEAAHAKMLAEMEGELNSLKLSALQKRAAAEGVDVLRIEECLDTDSPKASLVPLILACHPLTGQLADGGAKADDAACARAEHEAAHAKMLAEMEGELNSLKLSALQKRAAAEGVDVLRIEECLDTDSPKASLVPLILACHPLTGQLADGGATEISAPAAETSIRAELLELPLSVLRKRARSLGVTDDEIETAEDTNEPVAALADLAIARSGMQKHQTTAIATEQSMRAKLAGLNVSALKKRALAAGVREQSLRATEDSDLPMREAVVNLIVAQAKSQSPSSAQEQTLRNELGSLKLSQLKKRAYSSSVDKASIEEAEDGDFPQDDIIDLIVLMGDSSSNPVQDPGSDSGSPYRQPAPIQRPAALVQNTRRAHHGGGSSRKGSSESSSSITSAVQTPQTTKAIGFSTLNNDVTHQKVLKKLMSGRHAMLSYCWGDQLETQERVSRARKALVARGIDCWMDIDVRN